MLLLSGYYVSFVFPIFTFTILGFFTLTFLLSCLYIVYYEGKIIKGAHLNSFEYIEGCYECFRDKNNLYYRSEVYIGNLEELFGE